MIRLKTLGGSLKALGLGDGGWETIPKLRLRLPPERITIGHRLHVSH
jgi:hypothetical protein